MCHRQCCSGKELVDWLLKQNECMQSRSQAVGMWQVLVDEGILVHGKNLYRFDPCASHQTVLWKGSVNASGGFNVIFCVCFYLLLSHF